MALKALPQAPARWLRWLAYSNTPDLVGPKAMANPRELRARDSEASQVSARGQLGTQALATLPGEVSQASQEMAFKVSRDSPTHKAKEKAWMLLKLPDPRPLKVSPAGEVSLVEVSLVSPEEVKAFQACQEEAEAEAEEWGCQDILMSKAKKGRMVQLKRPSFPKKVISQSPVRDLVSQTKRVRVPIPSKSLGCLTLETSLEWEISPAESSPVFQVKDRVEIPIKVLEFPVLEAFLEEAASKAFQASQAFPVKEVKKVVSHKASQVKDMVN